MTIFRGGAVQIPPSPYRRYQTVSSFFMLGTRARRGHKGRPLPVGESNTTAASGRKRECEIL